MTGRAETPNFDRLVLEADRLFGLDRVILCGSAALAVRKIRDVGDLDLLVRSDVWAEIGEINEARHEYGRQVWRTDGIDAFETLPRLGSTFAEIQPIAEETHVNGRLVRVLPLRHVLAIKALAPRADKHTEDMHDIVDMIGYGYVQ